MVSMPLKRGAFIVLEGCDRSGKSTQSLLLYDFLKSKGIPVKRMVFPARETKIGHVIDAYLTNQQELSDVGIHMLFSANRWEFKNEMKSLLESGTSLVVDRYTHSGVAYSVAKGFDYDWCMLPEQGLLRPDAVFYLKTNIEKLEERGNFGEERYEKVEFQRKVAEIFNRMSNEEKDCWHIVDASQIKEDIKEQIALKTLDILQEVQGKPLKAFALHKTNH